MLLPPWPKTFPDIPSFLRKRSIYFCEDIADGHYDGKPAMLDVFQTLENPALRAFLKLDKSVDGIVIHKPYSDEPAYPLKEWDLITKIGDVPIDNEVNGETGAESARAFHLYCAEDSEDNGKVPLTIVRHGKEMHVDLPVSSDHSMLLRDLGNLVLRLTSFAGRMAFTARQQAND